MRVFWQPTFAAGILLHWAEVTPFGLLSGDQFRSAPPPPLTSNTYRKSYEEVKAVGDVNSPERPPDVARFYAVTGAVHVWNPIAAHLAAVRGATPLERARALALLNMAINDGLIASMDTKYYYQFWRPVTASSGGR